MPNTSLAKKQRGLITIEANKSPEQKKLRVAAYCRVSTASEDQMNSYVAQFNHYKELIENNERWQMADIYADEGISGTSMKKRDEFMRMLADCHRGVIDRILVKSISRFARNTKECLETVRFLKAIGVSVLFEEQGIDTTTVNSELLTSVFASMAQKESESISQNMRWSYRHRMNSGTFLPGSQPFGYTIENRRIVIEPDEAEIIKHIFEVYLNGINTVKIAEELNSGEGAKYRRWTHQAIIKILTNEKYIGDSLWQKSYSTDTFPVKRFRNHGERDQIYAKNTHPSIIDAEMFQRVQALLAKRSHEVSDKAKSPLQGSVRCGCCGKVMRKKEIRGKHYFLCRTHYDNKEACGMEPVRYDEIEKAYSRLYFKLKHHPEILEGYLTNIKKVYEHRMLWSAEVIEINKKISETTSQDLVLAELKKNGLVDPDIYYAQRNKLAEELRSLKSQKQKLVASVDSDDRISATEDLIEYIEAGPDMLDVMDAEFFSELIEGVRLISRTEIRFKLSNGLELTERLERNS